MGWVTLEGQHVYIGKDGTEYRGKAAIAAYHKDEGGTKTPIDQTKKTVTTPSGEESGSYDNPVILDEGYFPMDNAPDKYLSALADKTKALNGEEQQALKAFTSGSDTAMRADDRNGHGDKAFYAAYDKLPKYQGEMYRGIRELDKEGVAKLMENPIITLDAMSSFSRAEAVAVTFARDTQKDGSVRSGQSVVMRLASQTGRQAEHVSNFPREQEVIGAKGMSFKITKSYYAKYETQEKPTLVIEGHEV